QLNRLYSFTVTKEVQEELRLVVNRLESIVFDKEFKSKEMLNLTI
ncbi:MAG TPA: DNA repair protein RecO, partial [Eubacterium sp.]|nr:DNA repair protein RecO [Eubacterium sp.]